MLVGTTEMFISHAARKTAAPHADDAMLDPSFLAAPRRVPSFSSQVHLLGAFVP